MQLIKDHETSEKVNIITFLDDDNVEGEKIYRSNLEFQAITTESVGKYFCVYTNSIKADLYNYTTEVDKFKASSIYIFVDGEHRREAHLN